MHVVRGGDVQIVDKAGCPKEEAFEESRPLVFVPYYILCGSFGPSYGREEKNPTTSSSITVKS